VHPYWAGVIDNGFAVPADRSRAALVGELCDLLADPVPEVRDDTAYPVLTQWIIRGELDDQLAGLGDRFAATLRHPEVQARTFAAMGLAWVVLRDARTGLLPDAHVPAWRNEFARWWLSEPDLRGWDDRLGWLHAVAHGADALRAFGRSPRLAAPELAGLLDLATDRLLAPTGYVYAHGEEERLAYALGTVLSRPEVTETAATDWLRRITATLRAGAPGPIPAWAANTFGTLRALYVVLDRGVRWYDPDVRDFGQVTMPRHAGSVRMNILEALRVPAPYLG
jgi:hypothetical protein